MMKYGNVMRFVFFELFKKEFVFFEFFEKEVFFGVKLKIFGLIYFVYVVSVLLFKILILRIRKC